MLDPVAILQERWDWENRLTVAGATVLGGGYDKSGEWIIVVQDPHARRGPHIELVGAEEATQFLERLRA